MSQCYFDFNNNQFCYESEWGTLAGPSRGNVFSFRVENVGVFVSLIKRINSFCALNKSCVQYFVSSKAIKSECLNKQSFTSSLPLCLTLFSIKEFEYTDDNVTITQGVFIYAKCEKGYFELIVTYADYLEIKELYNNVDDDDFLEIGHSFGLETIKEDGSVSLSEDLVYDGGSFKVYLKKGDEHIHNRPHVQCKMDGEMYNISIDDNIEYLGKTAKKEKNVKFLVREISKETILQKARALWNSIPSCYKFDVDENGNYVTK